MLNIISMMMRFSPLRMRLCNPIMRNMLPGEIAARSFSSHGLFFYGVRRLSLSTRSHPQHDFRRWFGIKNSDSDTLDRGIERERVEKIDIIASSPEDPSSATAVESPLKIPGIHKTPGRKLAIVFTCTVCDTRSAKQISAQAYEEGVVLIKCPGCQNLHLIADRINFMDGGEKDFTDIEAEMAKTGGNFRRAISDSDVLELELSDIMGGSPGEGV